uniref:Uncharacterized protein n=1 Tax=virus sp. ctReX5 TaxID=2825818 RepID=A0A8S5RM08_9VIRU|nr:MAG TPA: hypothetical protein [virus sp. ctReX5]DAR81839.1 MAG TPA: hypothetical protein [Caudoviricetes sp.]
MCQPKTISTYGSAYTLPCGASYRFYLPTSIAFRNEGTLHFVFLLVQYSDYSCCPRFTKNSTHNL